ncbi:glyoxalase [Actinomycetospora sp. NBRC 106375]|uniref:VOC family protein n=1 Tax=Actinomycetospora sp. NBRC 106375 TaxID=3032207 RepID=UPI0024A02191|nr:VOC family protein [Actinomycetospora sp. NBRC 106375]GLZ49964.1 glyoxalase [Actinomycetospora sp. NBRC 106375]
MAVVVAVPTADRRVAHDFYTAGLGLEPLGETGDDGLPEPLQFVLGPGVTLMLIPTGGFGWVTADHEVAAPGQSECLLSVVVGTAAEVDALTDRARAAGAVVKEEPRDPGWGTWCSTVADPDGHLWMIQVDPTH